MLEDRVSPTNRSPSPPRDMHIIPLWMRSKLIWVKVIGLQCGRGEQDDLIPRFPGDVRCQWDARVSYLYFYSYTSRLLTANRFLFSSTLLPCLALDIMPRGNSRNAMSNWYTTKSTPTQTIYVNFTDVENVAKKDIRSSVYSLPSSVLIQTSSGLDFPCLTYWSSWLAFAFSAGS